MRLRQLRIRNFRSIESLDLQCGALVALLGRNGTGKSAVLRAVDLFYDSGTGLTAEDFHAGNTAEPIVIGVTFGELGRGASTLFAPYIQDGELSVDLVARLDGTKVVARYHGSRLTRPEFGAVRAAGNAGDKRAVYDGLRAQPDFADLPAWRNQNQAAEALDAWEAAHQADLVRAPDDGQFFGFKSVAQGYLGKFTRVVSIPAAIDAEEMGQEGRGSPLTQLVDLVVRASLAARDDIALFRTKIQSEYRRLLSPAAVPELGHVQDGLSKTLSDFAPGASVLLKWKELGELEVPLPAADVFLIEDGYENRVGRAGHGLQRAYALSLLQQLSNAAAPETTLEAEDLPNVVLLFEEPELYQHPSRQRHIAGILRKLSMGEVPGVSGAMQVLYATHSPLMVGIDRFEDIRLLRKRKSDANPDVRATTISSAPAAMVAERSWRAFGASGTPFTAAGELARMAGVMSPAVNEGFFADLAVLVEGDSDRAAILGEAARLGVSLDALGCAVLICGGKSKLIRPASVFLTFGIPLFLVWDGDHGKKDCKPEENRILQRLLGRPECDWPPLEIGVAHASFPIDLEATLRSDLGEDIYVRTLTGALEEFGLTKRADGRKNPSVVERMLVLAQEAGATSPNLTALVRSIEAAARAL